MGTHIQAIRSYLIGQGLDGQEHGDSQLIVRICGLKYADIRATIVAPDEKESVALRLWNLPKVPKDPEQRFKVYEAINKIHNSFLFAKLMIDDDDDIIAAVDAVVTPDTIGPVTFELLMRLAYIVDDASQELLPILGLDPADYAPPSEDAHTSQA